MRVSPAASSGAHDRGPGAVPARKPRSPLIDGSRILCHRAWNVPEFLEEPRERIQQSGQQPCGCRRKNQEGPKRKPTPRTVVIHRLEPSLLRRLLTCVSMVRPGFALGSLHTWVMICLREKTLPGREASR